ncbi:hypothetical protein ASPCAL09793 [Aspergillus calidoustus]|uniref:Uncharacterized protein n=1 Tax=Aspergillus calidoustus TaxID=454130 RepID=A0A0U5G6T9_ASPCI|nr:hypothetical protein ASPCAL09793 [Aspergillus calidoustus]
MSTEDTMEPKTNGIDDFPEHWKATLLGEVFWKDAEDWNKDTNAKIEAEHEQSLHTRFPFNIGAEQVPRAPSINTSAVDSDEAVEATAVEKRSRRFSMSDALSLNLFSSSRSLELGRHCRSRSRSNNRGRSSSVTPDVRRSDSLIRSTFNRMSLRMREKSEEEEEEAKEEEEELMQLEEPVVAIPIFSPDQATPANPLMEFRGGALWAALPKDRRTLGIDVFWPVPSGEDKDDKENVKKHNYDEEKEEKPTIFPIDEMAPVCMFRNLRVLKITGMMQSYQMYIFQAAWLNTNLDELEIGMALPPRLRRGYKWPYIKGGWQLNKTTMEEPVYYGTGEGSLLHKVGVGEYLDKMCLEKAKIRAMAMGSTRNRLSIRTLVLTGVVVDADPFLHWFDPKRLKCINFKDYCVDAGFYLSHCMKKVSILFPRMIEEPVLRGRRVNPAAELKVIELKGGKKVGEIPYRGPQSLKENIPRNVNVNSSVGVQSDEHKKKGEEEVMDESQVGIAF